MSASNMKTATLAVLVLGATLISACANAPASKREPMSWGYVESSSDEGPKLAFGVEDTDNVAIVFICDVAKDRIDFVIPVAHDHDVPTMKLKSGAAVRRYESFFPQEPDGYEMAHFATDRGDRVVKAFSKSGKLALNPYGRYVADDAVTPADRAAVASFAKACALR